MNTNVRRRSRALLKCLATAVAFVTAMHASLAQPKFGWVRAATTSQYCGPRAAAANDAGDCWVVGRFLGSVDFGTTNLTPTVFSTWDSFLARYSPEGQLLWVKQAGGGSPDEGQAVALDDAGNAYVHGFFNGSASFDSTNLNAIAGNESFIARYDPAGALTWVVRCGGGGPGQWASIAVDAERNVYAGGTFAGAASFGPLNLTSVAGNYNAFVVKLNASGEFQWVRTFGGRGAVYGRSLAVSRTGEITLVGGFADVLALEEHCLFSRGAEDYYVVRLTADGEIRWVRSGGEGGQESAFAVAADPAGNAYVGGTFTGSLTIGSTNLNSLGGSEVFVAKFDPDGQVIWGRNFAGGSDDQVSGLAVDKFGHVHVTGQTYSSPLQVGATNLQAYGSLDAYAAKLTTDGEPIWGLRLGSGNNDYGYGVALDAQANVYFAGQFGYQMPILNGVTNLYTPGSEGMFLTRWDRDLPILESQPASTAVMESSPLTLQVVVAGTGPFRFQWLRDQVPLPNATNSTLFIASVSTNLAGMYQVEVANPEGAVVSAPATVDVLTIAAAADTAGLVWTSGGNAVWVNQTNATFDGLDAMRSGAITNSQQSWMETKITGPARLNFLWKISCENGYDFLRLLVNGVEVTNTSGKVEWKSVSLLLGPGLNTVRWSYTKDESESVGQDAGWVDQVSVVYRPTVVTGPVSQIVTAGLTATFSVAAGGTPPFQFQWQRDGTNVAGATNAVLLFTNVSPALEASYTVTIANPGGSITSAAARLTVRVPPPITSQPLNQTVTLGGTARFTVVASAIPGLRYQWQWNGTNLAGATNATLSLTNVTSAHAGVYSVVVTTPTGSTESLPALLTVVDLILRPTILVAGTPGRSYRIDYAEQLTPTNWIALTNLLLPASPYHHVDYSAERRPRRFYRVVPQ